MPKTSTLECNELILDFCIVEYTFLIKFLANIVDSMLETLLFIVHIYDFLFHYFIDSIGVTYITNHIKSMIILIYINIYISVIFVLY